MFEKLIPYDVAHVILSAYMRYHHQFKRITKRAKIRFENRDWQGIQQDTRERNILYRDMVGDTTEAVLKLLGEKAQDRDIWKAAKQFYYEDIVNFNTRNISETFYNSVFRHSHKGLSADEELMFVHATGTYREFKSTLPIYYNFYLTRHIQPTVAQLFACFPFDAPFEDLDRDIQYISTVLERKLKEHKLLMPSIRLEVLKSIFYRNKGGYIVGRLFIQDRPIPFIIPLLNGENGIYTDTLLLDYNDVSSIFSYNRTYFLVDVDIVSEMVDFMRTILPSKSLGELYTSIGFEKHGKTVFYRDFLRYLDNADDQFDFAPGIKGMVMSVFTLPTYNMVFKVIKDRFAPPKKVTEEIVREKYELVKQHDRVGRMADSYPFENLVFDRKRFNEDLVAELQEEAASKIVVTDTTVEIKHLYVEKKMVPLNLYLENADKQEAEKVIDDYGKAIKQLAAVNIFPGDMLLKNFGVTRLKRVVFYDYDEIGFLTDYKFRIIPEPRDEYEEMSSEPYFHVGPDDIFPEEFPRFLIGNPEIRAIFYKLHGDLYAVHFWKNMQAQLERGEMVDVFPYNSELRFCHIFKKESIEKAD